MSSIKWVVVCASIFLNQNCLAVQMIVLHTNDIHARFEQVNKFAGRCPAQDAKEGKCFGGTARLKTMVDEIRSKEKNVILLNAGDYYQGTLYFNLQNWNITSNFMNRIDYDAMALGNHEFDNGVDGLVPFLKAINFPVLACNMNVSKEPRLKGLFECVKIIDLENGEQVGIVGYLTPETASLANPGLNVVLTEEVEALKPVVNDLKRKGVKIIIAVGHSGFTKDKEIAEKVDGVDIVIGGHTNTFLYNGEPPSVEIPVGPYPYVIKRANKSKVLVVQSYAYGLYLGKLIVDFDKNGEVEKFDGNPIFLTSKVKEDPETLAALAPYKAEVDKYGTVNVGTTDVLLRGDREICRMKECNLGNMLTDAVLDYYRTVKKGHKEKPVRSTIWNSGGIRSSIDEQINKGLITMGDVLTVAPFGNTIDLVTVNGSHFREIMEHSVVFYDPTGEDPPGGFLQVSGIKVGYDLTRPPGSRVVSLRALCSLCRVPKYLEVNVSQTYLIAVPTYLVNGGDGFKIKNEKEDNILHSGDVDSDIIISYLKRMSPIFSPVEGRITFIEEQSCNSGTKVQFSIYSFILVLFLTAISRRFTGE